MTRPARGLDLALRLGVPFLVTVACAWVGVRLVGQARFALIPIAIAMLLTALLSPVVRWMRRRLHLGSYLAGAIALLTSLGIIVAVLWYALTVVLEDMGSITELAQNVLRDGAAWLRDGPLHLDNAQLDEGVDKGQEWLAGHSSNIVSTVMTFSGSLSELLAMALLGVISAFFFLGDGPKIWSNLLWLVPARSRTRQYEASRRSWRSLELYARTAVIVAVIDAVCIGVGAALLKVPFPLPLAMLVFVSAFVPFVGAIASGAVAVVLALFTGGPTTALLMALVVLAVQQLEGNVLQPLLMGRAVSLHPYAVIVGVSLAGYLWSLVGALLAVPVMAVVMSWLRYLNDTDPFPHLDDVDDDEENRPYPKHEDDGQGSGSRPAPVSATQDSAVAHSG
ncbi:AI-2E family transporter [Luteococcus sp. H138]|uniref:AI-2E family transporter n=1 Tax=unclassified Luteococcus TaxID=2639923 RepID=UPI00313BE573